jgi:hypothetical protein
MEPGRLYLSGRSRRASVSGRAPFVAVMETADLLNRNDSSELGRLHGPRLRQSLENERCVLER